MWNMNKWQMQTSTTKPSKHNTIKVLFNWYVVCCFGLLLIIKHSHTRTNKQQLRLRVHMRCACVHRFEMLLTPKWKAAHRDCVYIPTLCVLFALQPKGIRFQTASFPRNAPTWYARHLNTIKSAPVLCVFYFSAADFRPPNNRIKPIHWGNHFVSHRWWNWI